MHFQAFDSDTTVVADHEDKVMAFLFFTSIMVFFEQEQFISILLRRIILLPLWW